MCVECISGEQHYFVERKTNIICIKKNVIREKKLMIKFKKECACVGVYVGYVLLKRTYNIN